LKTLWLGGPPYGKAGTGSGSLLTKGAGSGLWADDPGAGKLKTLWSWGGPYGEADTGSGLLLTTGGGPGNWA
jgi:hypothetical protein